MPQYTIVTNDVALVRNDAFGWLLVCAHGSVYQVIYRDTITGSFQVVRSLHTFPEAIGYARDALRRTDDAPQIEHVAPVVDHLPLELGTPARRTFGRR